MNVIKIIIMGLFLSQGGHAASYDIPHLSSQPSHTFLENTRICSGKSFLTLSDTLSVVCHFVDLKTMAHISMTNKTIQKSLYDVLLSLHIALNKADLSFLTTQSHFTSFMSWTRYLPKLHSISLPPHPSLTLTDTLLHCLALHCRSLTHITLKKCHHISSECIQSLAQPNLEYLKIANCPQINDDSLLLFAENCSHLHSIHLADCPHITDASFVHFILKSPFLVNIHLFHCQKITDIFVDRELYPWS